MGRRDRPTPPGQVLRQVGRSHEVVIADEALRELDELISYIRKDSPKNALAVYDAISTRLFALRTGAESLGRVGPLAHDVPAGATARVTTIKKVAIDYLFPMRQRRRQIVFVVSIRRGRRQPLERPEYARRWLEELADLVSPER